MSKRTWMFILIGFIALALAQEPAQFADMVSRAWDGLTDGGGQLLDGFFTFVDRLG